MTTAIVEQPTQAQRDYIAAMKSLQHGIDSRAGAQGKENAQASAYQRMVAEGTAPQIRRKYRRGRALKQVR